MSEAVGRAVNVVDMVVRDERTGASGTLLLLACDGGGFVELELLRSAVRDALTRQRVTCLHSRILKSEPAQIPGLLSAAADSLDPQEEA